MVINISIRISKHYLRIAATIPLTSGEIWYKKLKETVENAQMQPVWMSETKVKQFILYFQFYKIRTFSSKVRVNRFLRHGHHIDL